MFRYDFCWLLRPRKLFCITYVQYMYIAGPNFVSQICWHILLYIMLEKSKAPLKAPPADYIIPLYKRFWLRRITFSSPFPFLSTNRMRPESFRVIRDIAWYFPSHVVHLHHWTYLATIEFMGPEAYLVHLTDRCPCLNCSLRMGRGGLWSGTLWIHILLLGGGAVRYEFITYRSASSTMWTQLYVCVVTWLLNCVCGGGGGALYIPPTPLDTHTLNNHLDFLGPKSLDFQGPPLQAALVMDFPASKSIRPAPYKH